MTARDVFRRCYGNLGGTEWDHPSTHRSRRPRRTGSSNAPPARHCPPPDSTTLAQFVEPGPCRGRRRRTDPDPPHQCRAWKMKGQRDHPEHLGWSTSITLDAVATAQSGGVASASTRCMRYHTSVARGLPLVGWRKTTTGLSLKSSFDPDGFTRRRTPLIVWGSVPGLADPRDLILVRS